MAEGLPMTFTLGKKRKGKRNLLTSPTLQCLKMFQCTCTTSAPTPPAPASAVSLSNYSACIQTTTGIPPSLIPIPRTDQESSLFQMNASFSGNVFLWLKCDVLYCASLEHSFQIQAKGSGSVRLFRGENKPTKKWTKSKLYNRSFIHKYDV